MGCTGSGGSGDDEPMFEPDATWTVMIYGHGDHNLSPSLQVDIEEMKAATLRENVTVIVLADLDASQGAAHPAGSHWLKIAKGRTEMIETGPELDLDDPGVLASSIERAFKLAPADRYGLVMWNHGGAWEGGFGGDTQNGGAHKPGMMMPAAAMGVRVGLQRAGVEYLDLFAFDTCLLGGAESAAEFVGIADIYIANGELDYGDGLDYKALLSYLSEKPHTTYAQLATADAAAYKVHHERELIDRLLHAHVALRLDRMPDVMTRAKALVDTIDSPDAAIAVGRAMFAAAPHYLNSQFTPDGSGNPGLHDIGQVTDVLADSNDGSIASAANALRASLGELVLASSLGELRAGTQIGMNVELTKPFEASAQKLADYRAKAAAWSKATGWDKMIEGVAGFADEQPPVVNGSLIAPDAVRFDIPDADVADVSFELGVIDNGVEYGYGFVAAGAVRPNVALDMTWGGEVNAMQTSDGLEAVFAAPWALSYAADGNPQFKMMFVPGVLQGGGEEALVMLLFDPSTGKAPVFTIFDPMSKTWATRTAAELAPANVVFRPIIPSIDQAGSVSVLRLGTIAVTAAGLSIQSAFMNPGSYRLNLYAKDLWANEALYPFDLTIGGGRLTRPANTKHPRPRLAWLERVIAAERAGSVTVALSNQRPIRTRPTARASRMPFVTLRR